MPQQVTALLQQAITAAEKLPPDVQDAIASRLLAEIADEQSWVSRFASTTDAQWDRMADSVRRAIQDGEVSPLEDMLAPDESL
jgi:hypothetical protein